MKYTSYDSKCRKTHQIKKLFFSKLSKNNNTSISFKIQTLIINIRTININIKII